MRILQAALSSIPGKSNQIFKKDKPVSERDLDKKKNKKKREFPCQLSGTVAA